MCWEVSPPITTSRDTRPLRYLTRASFEGISQQVNIESPLVRLAVRVMHAGDVFLWPTLFVLVPTILMGATFPLIATLALSDRNREGQTVGIVYFLQHRRQRRRRDCHRLCALGLAGH